MKNLRFYGERPYKIAVLHGGPGAPGEMAPVARELSSLGGVLEPLQTKKSIAGQVRELHDVIKKHGEPTVILIGWSWGAWLAFIFAANHPSFMKKLVLIGSGPFEEKYADEILPTRLARLSEDDRVEVLAIAEALNHPAMKDRDGMMARFGALMDRADSYDPLPHDGDLLAYQYDINQRIWNEASALRKSGELLKLGKKIRCPVTAIHGDYDPHPTSGVREPLSRTLKDFKFILLKKCGHHPWVERQAKERFYEILRGEI